MTRTLSSTATVPASLRPPAAGGLSSLVRAAGLARLDAAAMAPARRAPGPVPQGWKPIAPTFLKTSDDQTVAAACAVFDAIATLPEAAPDAFDGWGVVVASRYLGRAQLDVALRRFDEEGVWGVSPHLIPHFALHSPAGTLSLALGAHGPNLGVGGGPLAAMDGALTALSWLSEGRLPGAWLVLTGHDPEFVPVAPAGSSECRALALALTPDDGRPSPRPRLRLVASEADDDPGPPDLAALHARIVDASGRGTVAAAGGLRLEWAGDDARRAW